MLSYLSWAITPLLQHMQKRDRILYEANNQCYYCGCAIDNNTRFESNSACLNLFIPKRYGGTRAAHNLVASCYSCAAFCKKDLDTTSISLAAVRKYINLERKRQRLPYNKDFANLDVEIIEARRLPTLPSNLTDPNIEDDGL